MPSNSIRLGAVIAVATCLTAFGETANAGRVWRPSTLHICSAYCEDHLIDVRHANDDRRSERQTRRPLDGRRYGRRLNLRDADGVIPTRRVLRYSDQGHARRLAYRRSRLRR